MALEPLQEEHQKLQKSLQATVSEMRRLRLPLGKCVMIMTDKFFSNKLESLKSLITRRLSKPSILNTESPTPSFDSSPYASMPVSPVDGDQVPPGHGAISKDPIYNTPQSAPAWTSHTTYNTISSDRTTYTTPHGLSLIGQTYTMNYDHSYTSDNTISPSARTMYTTPQGPSPDGQAYTMNYDHSHAPDNTMSPSDRNEYTTPRGPSSDGQVYNMNYDHSHAPNNTMSPSDRYKHTTPHRLSTDGQAYTMNHYRSCHIEVFSEVLQCSPHVSARHMTFDTPSLPFPHSL